ncbi:MAG: pyruvate, phosphate dikinase [Clostridia bacterium]|nr:pyruvate, phosphate dikinase [Clostridia bacterium]
MKKDVFMFAEGNASMRDILGGKGANLCEMANIGLPVPPGFVVSSNVCADYYKNEEKLSTKLEENIITALRKLEKTSNKEFGNPNKPLLVSVRSGSRVSMPGMMDTILNLGINDKVAKGFATLTGNERFVYDCYRRFILMFSDVVMELDTEEFDRILQDAKDKKKIKYDYELDVEDLKNIIKKNKVYYKEKLGVDFPQEPEVQLMEAIKAVIRSWNNQRAILYRKINAIPNEWGTAITIQSMVFGNTSNKSGSGVAFTRDPATGENKLFGEFLMNAQGEDVVAGIRTPAPISHLEQENPALYKQFKDIAHKLETHYKDMQDIEFTIEDSKLYILQTRNAKRTIHAGLKVAMDLYREGALDEKEALLKVDASQLPSLLLPQFDTESLKKITPIGKGLPASPGAGCGMMAFNATKAIEWKAEGKKVVLVRQETLSEDIEGMSVSEAVVTARGGMTSHAAVVARGMGKCCVTGCEDIQFSNDYVTFKDKKYVEGDIISVNGSTGFIYEGKIDRKPATLPKDFLTIMEWAKKYKILKVYQNADTPTDARAGVELGAEGIGLCRTEHMFFKAGRIEKMREMIVANTLQTRQVALDKLLPMQRQDFTELYQIMKGMPVTIRLLDPPLHEFLPDLKNRKEIADLAQSFSMTEEKLEQVINDLHEFNPMMGHRGCRLAVSYPEIYNMQARAIIEAALNVKKENGFDIKPEIMIPIICDLKEFEFVKNNVEKTVKEVLANANATMEYKIGTMIELPRAALMADKIAEQAKFFSFGTNDLTQFTYGFSRDDATKFLKSYYENRIFDFDPFVTIDQNGVGSLMKMASEKGRSVRPDIKIGICGEHGGEAKSVDFCHRIGLNYVSCSPFRVPTAILAAAQANINNPKK